MKKAFVHISTNGDYMEHLEPKTTEFPSASEFQKDEEQGGQIDIAIQEAIEARNEELASLLIRRKRNVLLSKTDNEMSLDRLQLTVPRGILFSDWLKFFQQIAQLLTGDMAQYRQALRDIPQQEGFPFDVKFPEKPEG